MLKVVTKGKNKIIKSRKLRGSTCNWEMWHFSTIKKRTQLFGRKKVDMALELEPLLFPFFFSFIFYVGHELKVENMV